MKRDGRNHTYAEKLQMQAVKHLFGKKKDELGAKKAAAQLGVSLPSFYNYVAGKNLPRREVQRRAWEMWGIKLPMTDPSDLVRVRHVRSAEQLTLSLLDAVRESDVEIVKVRPAGNGVLQVKLRIHFLGTIPKIALKTA